MGSPPEPSSVRLVQRTEEEGYACIAEALDLNCNGIDVSEEKFVVGAVWSFVQCTLQVEASCCSVEPIVPGLRSAVVQTVWRVPVPYECINTSTPVETDGIFNRM